MPQRSCPYAGTTRIRFEGLPRPEKFGPAASQPPAGAPLGRGDYPQRTAPPSRLRFDDMSQRSGSTRLGLAPSPHVLGGGYMVRPHPPAAPATPPRAAVPAVICRECRAIGTLPIRPARTAREPARRPHDTLRSWQFYRPGILKKRWTGLDPPSLQVGGSRPALRLLNYSPGTVTGMRPPSRDGRGARICQRLSHMARR